MRHLNYNSPVDKLLHARVCAVNGAYDPAVRALVQAYVQNTLSIVHFIKDDFFIKASVFSPWHKVPILFRAIRQ